MSTSNITRAAPSVQDASRVMLSVAPGGAHMNWCMRRHMDRNGCGSGWRTVETGSDGG